MDEQLMKFWEIEEITKSRNSSAEDVFCENHYKENTRRGEDGRYIVALPFKPQEELSGRLGESRRGALMQFLRNEKSLAKKGDLKSKYDEVLVDYLKRNHMSRINTSVMDEPDKYYYLPHHAVLKPESTST